MEKYDRSFFPPGTADTCDHPLPFSLDWTRVENLSYDRLRSKIYDKVGAGVDLVEHRQAIGMIVSSATALTKAYRAVRQLRFGDAASALRAKFLPKGVSAFKSAGNNWLEFHFGWQPLVKDIYDGLQVIADPVKSFSLERGRSFDVLKLAFDEPITGSVKQDWTAYGKMFSTQGCRVKFAQPGTSHTLDQWGISNPAALAWEAIPFSFVVDWFVNVGDFLQSQTDFAGMTIESVYRSRYYDITVNRIRYILPGFGTGLNRTIIRYAGSERLTSLSGINLEVKKFKSISIVRAATAISLLLQALGD